MPDPNPELRIAIGGLAAVVLEDGVVDEHRPTAALFMGASGHRPVLALDEDTIVSVRREFCRTMPYHLDASGRGWVLIDVRGCEVRLDGDASSLELHGVDEESTLQNPLKDVFRLDWIYPAAACPNPFAPLGPKVPARLHLDRGRLESLPRPDPITWSFGSVASRHVADAAVWRYQVPREKIKIVIAGDVDNEIELAPVKDGVIDASIYSVCDWHGMRMGGFDHQAYGPFTTGRTAVEPTRHGGGGEIRPGSEKCSPTRVSWK